MRDGRDPSPGSLQPGKGVGNRESHPTHRSDRNVIPYRIHDIDDERTRIIIGLLIADDTITRLQHSLLLLLNRQGFIIWQLIVQGPIGRHHLTGIVGHYGTRSLWKLLLRIQARKRWRSDYRVIIPA